MTALARTIMSLVQGGRYLVGMHAVERLDERGILEWQVVEAMERGRFLHERLDGIPHPTAEFELTLPDGTPVKAVWAHMGKSNVAKLVTVHYLSR